MIETASPAHTVSMNLVSKEHSDPDYTIDVSPSGVVGYRSRAVSKLFPIAERQHDATDGVVHYCCRRAMKEALRIWNKLYIIQYRIWW
jgi:DNA-directed RNA polymerase subunit N (RpoN/RPB10)